jgi:hypothetical protein
MIWEDFKLQVVSLGAKNLAVHMTGHTALGFNQHVSPAKHRHRFLPFVGASHRVRQQPQDAQPSQLISYAYVEQTIVGLGIRCEEKTAASARTVGDGDKRYRLVG